MFDLHSITMVNFKSYAGEHSFEFPTAPGLYGLTGLNLAVPRLGPNGTGKSTLLDAIYWVLYGKTSRGLKGVDVITWWGQKTCSVKLALTVGDQRSIIYRSQSPNKLTLDDNVCDQKEIQEYLRITPEAFLYAVMIPQFGDAFFDINPTAKLHLFSDILELKHWVERSKIAEEMALNVTTALSTKETSLSRTKTGVELILSNIKDLKALEADFERCKNDDLKQHSDKKLDLLKQRKNIQSLLALDKGALATANTLLASNETKLEKLEVAKSNLLIEHRGITNYLSTTVAHKKMTRLQYDALAGITNACPTCLQKVDPVFQKSEMKRLVGLEALYDTDIFALNSQITEIKAEISDVEQRISTLQTTIKNIRKNQKDFTDKITQHQFQLGTVDGLLTALEVVISDEEKSENPYTTQISVFRETIKLAGGKIASLEKKVKELKAEHTAVSFWVQGFKRIRLMIVDETLQQLELEVNNNLANLGLLDWHITFDVERENKSGGITKGFVVMVHPPHGNPVRFEAYSGGETQRLRLAGDLGLANLIMHRAGLSNTIEFYDEPSRHLSPEGVLDLAETLQERAIASGKRIFLIDHQNIDFDFTGRYTAVIDKDGSHLRHDN